MVENARRVGWPVEEGKEGKAVVKAPDGFKFNIVTDESSGLYFN